MNFFFATLALPNFLCLRALLPLLLLVVGCAGAPSTAAKQRAGFEAYFQEFQAYSAKFGRVNPDDNSVGIVFSTLRGTEAGRCEIDSSGGRQVLIDQQKWARLDKASRKVLVFHELGHCVLGRVHSDGGVHLSDTRGVSFFGRKSLMSPTALPGETFERNPTYYLNELFEQGTEEIRLATTH